MNTFQETLNVVYSPYFTYVSSESDRIVCESDFVDYTNGYQNWSAEDNNLLSDGNSEEHERFLTETTRKCIDCGKTTLKCFVLCSNCFMMKRRNNIRRQRRNGRVTWTLRDQSKCSCVDCKKSRSTGIVLHKRGGHIVNCYYYAQRKLKTTTICFVCLKPFIGIIRNVC